MKYTIYSRYFHDNHFREIAPELNISRQDDLSCRFYSKVSHSVIICGLLYDIKRKKSYPFMVHPLLPVPRLYRNLGVIPG